MEKDFNTMEEENLFTEQPDIETSDDVKVASSGDVDVNVVDEDTPSGENLFSAKPVNEEGEVEKPVTTELTPHAVYNYLTEKGFVEADEKEDFASLSEADMEDYIEETLDQAVDFRMKEAIADLPSFVKDITKYVLNGGRYEDFINAYTTQQGTTPIGDIDINDENNQQAIVVNALRADGYDDEYIGLQLKFLTENGKLAQVAAKHYQTWKAQEEHEKQKLFAAQEQARAHQRAVDKQQKVELNKYVSNIDSVGDIVLSKADKRNVVNYINDKTVKLTDGTYITQLQKELFYDLPQTRDGMVQLAILMRNRYEDGTFNFENIKRQVQTEVTRGIKDNVRRTKDTVPNDTQTQRKYVKKALADFFD